MHPSSAVHPLRKIVFEKKMDCGVKPGNDEGETVPTILHPFEWDRFSATQEGKSGRRFGKACLAAGPLQFTDAVMALSLS